MRVTIIADDNIVLVEEFAERVDLSGLNSDIHAVQWYGTRGEVEYKMDFIKGQKKPNTEITNFEPFQKYVDLWMVEAQKNVA